MAEQYLLLLNEGLKRHILSLGQAEKRRLQEKLDFLANGIWDAGVRVKKLKGAGRKVVFEARLSRGDRLLFTLGRHRERIAAYVWGIASHDEVGRRGRSIIPENAPFLSFEAESTQELPELIMDQPVPEWFSQENIEEKAGEGYGPQKWLVLNEEEWRRLLTGGEPDSLELHLFLTEEQSLILQKEPPVLLSGTAGSGKTTILVYYLLRQGFRRRLFLTYSLFLQRFSQRIYQGLVKNTDLEESPEVPAGTPGRTAEPAGTGGPSAAAPEFRVFRELVESILGAHGAAPARGAEVRLPEFERIFRNHKLYRRYDPELVWEEIRSIIKGAKPPIDAPGCRRLAMDYLLGNLGPAGLRRLQEYLLGLKPFEWLIKIHRILERKTDYPSYELFVQSLADQRASANGKAEYVLKEVLRLVEEKSRGFQNPLLTFNEYCLLGRKRAPNFRYDRQEIYSIAEYYQERLQAEGKWDEIDLCRRALAVMAHEEEPYSYDLVVCDEVQDFADIQIALVMRLARPFERVVFAGDLKQIINPSGFRWEDVKQKFYERGREPPEVSLLNLNFRCVGSIVRLANSLLELKQALVGLSGTEVREDWKFQGKPPFLVAGIAEEEVLRLARISVAGRIILVRDGAEQRRLKALLASELVFTIHEAKGLEFDAVLLWKFGQDRKSGDLWRRIQRGEPLEPAHEPHLRHELNLLYVAVTRARNILVFYDGPQASTIWEAGDLGQLIHRTADKEVLAGLWQKASTPEQWQEQGDYFFEREYFAAAAECYRNAGNKERQEIAEAFAFRARGEPERGAELFARHGYHREAAEGFEKLRQFAEAAAHWRQGDEPKKARVCELRFLESERKYEEAASGWEELGEPEEAARNWAQSRNHARLAEYLYAQKKFAEAAEHYREAGELARAAESYRRSRNWNKAADLYYRSEAWDEAALLYKKLKNQDRLLDCYEKAGDHYAAAVLHEKRKDLERSIAAFRRFAGQGPEQRERLEREAQSYQRGTLKAALRYSALSRFDRSAPLFQARGYLERARADYLAGGNLPAAAECLARMAQHLKAAREMEGLEFPQKEERIRETLAAHLRRGWGYDPQKARELEWEAEDRLGLGDARGALRRFQVLEDQEGVLRSLLGLKSDAEALPLLLAGTEPEAARRYVEQRGGELEVSVAVLERLVAELEQRSRWYVQEEEMALFTLLLTRSLSANREATLPLLRRVFSLRQPFFAFTEAYPENQLRILLEARNCNTIFMMLRWHSHGVAALPPFLPPFLEAVERAGREAGDTALLACAAYLQDQERFEGLVAGLPVDECNYSLVGGSARDYRRAVSWLLERPHVESWQVNEAVGICRMQSDFSLAGSLLERYGHLEEAARHYREGGLFPQALALFRKLGDEPNQARMHERLEEWEQALAIWRKRHRPRDVQRVLKQQAKTRKKPKKPKPEIQEETASRGELF